MAKVPTILRGEDTAARGRSLAINLPEGDYTGLTIRLQWCGLERSWESPASGASLTFDLSARETLPIPLGTHMGRLAVILADGTGYIISEDIRIRVTDDVAEATGADNAIEITPRDAAATLDIDLTGIEDEPATPDALRAAWKELLSRLRAAAGVALVCVGLAATARAEGRVEVQTAASGSLPWGAPVVTNVTVVGEMGLDGGTVTNIVNGLVEAATNAIPRGIAEEADPTVAYTNGTYYIKGQRFQALPSNGGLWRSSISVSDRQGYYGGSAVDIEGDFVSVGHAGNQTIYQQGKIVNKGNEINIPEASGTFALEEDLEDFVTTDTLSGYVPKTKHELHADMATNIVWKNVYSNGWVYLVPYSNNLEDAE